MGGIAGALIYLRLVTLKNLLRSRVLRLKQPKYLLGAVVGVAYIYFFFLRQRMARANLARMSDVLPPEQMAGILVLSASLLLIFFALCWLWTRDRASLSFSEAEIAFLFPAPISRKALIHFQLIGAQLKLVLSSLIFGFLSGRWEFASGNMTLRFIAWWIIFSTVTMHISGSAFTLTNWSDRGVSPLLRRLFIGGFLAVVIGATWFWQWRSWPAPSHEELSGVMPTFAYLAQMLDSGPLSFLLLPLKWLIAPLFATDAAAFLRVLGPALAVMAIHYLWVLNSEASFEEASIAAAQKRATRIAAMRAGNYRLNSSAPKARATPFDINRASSVEFAFLWKNLMASASYLRLRNALVAALIIVVGCLWLKSADHNAIRTMIGAVAAMMSGYVFVFGPMIARQDLRSDLSNADILKTYPLHGWQIVLGQMLTPVIVISVLMWLLLLTAALAFEVERAKWLTLEVRTWGAIGIALLIPLLCAVQVWVLNAAAVLFPAWIQNQTNRNAGVDVMGQRILFFAGLLLTMVVALVPAVLVGTVIYLIVLLVASSKVAAVLGVAGVFVVLVAEIAAGIQWLGTRFERFDLSAELRP